MLPLPEIVLSCGAPGGGWSSCCSCTSAWFLHAQSQKTSIWGFPDMEGIPKSSILVWLSRIFFDHPFWGIPSLGNLHFNMEKRHWGGSIAYSPQSSSLWIAYFPELKKPKPATCSMYIPMAYQGVYRIVIYCYDLLSRQSKQIRTTNDQCLAFPRGKFLRIAAHLVIQLEHLLGRI